MEGKGVIVDGRPYQIVDYVFQTGRNGDAILQLELKEIEKTAIEEATDGKNHD